MSLPDMNPSRKLGCNPKVSPPVLGGLIWSKSD